MKKKTKLFIGPVNVANNSYSFLKALRAVGVEADYYTWSTKKNVFGYKTDKLMYQFKLGENYILNVLLIRINTFLRVVCFVIMLFKYNTFLFNSPHTFLKANKDLKYLSFLNKKVIIIFPGCVERMVELYPNNPEYICNRCEDIRKQNYCKCNKIEEKRSFVRKLEEYSNYIISQDDSAGYLTEPNNIWFNVIIEEPIKKNYLKKYEGENIVISHLPSNPKIKMSDVIIPVMKRVADQYQNVEIIVKSGISHEEVLSILQKSHILIDALGLSYGSLAIEGMARGNIVIVGNMPFIEERFPSHPLITASSVNLYDVIIKLIENKNELKALAENSIQFYNKYHSLVAAGSNYKKVLNLN